jgi:hypothetical protein
MASTKRPHHKTPGERVQGEQTRKFHIHSVGMADPEESPQRSGQSRSFLRAAALLRELALARAYGSYAHRIEMRGESIHKKRNPPQDEKKE